MITNFINIYIYIDQVFLKIYKIKNIYFMFTVLMKINITNF